jgi:hydroxyacylglutathione hydrolase
MVFERIVSEGLAHYSYFLGQGTKALVIDPRRDCQIYVDMAADAGMRITDILETHRNEDYVIGSVELANRTGAEIWHVDAELDYEYGQAVEEGQTWSLGARTLRALSTPGHTPGSMSYVLEEGDGYPWMVFTGDALFAGDVGRTDLPGLDRIEEMTGLLYDSIFEKLLPLGDEVIVCPAHGAGSVCGAGIVDRNWTTIGIERAHNPKLQFKTKNAFIDEVGVALERPPYFRKMEALNLQGAPLPGGRLPTPTPMAPEAFAEVAKTGQVVDIRSEFAFGSAHVPDSLSIWEDGVPSFAGWFLGYDTPIYAVSAKDDVEQFTRMMVRIGYDQVDGFLAGGMHAWHGAGLASQATGTVTVQQLCHILDAKEEPWILDVRSDEELAESKIPLAHHIHLTQLPEKMDQVPQDRPVYIFCGSGLRSMIAASLLRPEGWEHLFVVLGGMSGWNSVSCPLEE